MLVHNLTGDIIDVFDAGKISVLFHSCNCFNTWGAGLAKQIKKRYPRACDSDGLTAKGDPKKLGQFTFAIFGEQIICNLYGQYKYGRDKQHTDYDALLLALENARNWLLKMGRTNEPLGFPHGMACGLGGGDFNIVSKMIEYVFKETEFTVIFYRLPDIKQP